MVVRVREIIMSFTDVANIKISEIDDFEISDVDSKDYPDFCAAWISYVLLKNGRELNDDEIDEFNGCGEFNCWIHSCAFDSLI